MQIGIKENKQSILLDPKLAPMLWFHYNYYMPMEESDNEDNEESGDDDDVSDEDEFSETSDADESTEETDDDGISEDNEIDVNGDDDDNTTDEAKEWGGGKFYTTFGDRIVTLEFFPYPTFDIIPIKSTHNIVYHYAEICLLESSGDLFILFFYHPMRCSQKTVEIDVHKLDITRRA
uniref:Uncharacterized protein n=1 Tax=Oryza barthii TaxID=65489 RepID=A0A0D3H6H3_9ORYZ